jgi:hypothetical protein
MTMRSPENTSDIAKGAAIMKAMRDLIAARHRMEHLFRKKPRLAPMMDAYIRIANDVSYPLDCAEEAIERWQPVKQVEDRINRLLRRIERLNARLMSDPYICRSPDKIRAWEARRLDRTPDAVLADHRRFAAGLPILTGRWKDDDELDSRLAHRRRARLPSRARRDLDRG